MPNPQDHLGQHPLAPNIFHRWFSATDHPVTAAKSHRQLSHLVDSNDAEVTEWLARKIVKHHYSDAEMNRLRAKYTALGFPEYAAQYRKIPVADRTRKGNATEIILLEYILECQPWQDMVYTYRLRYNTNVDQAMKGDDVLLVNRYLDANARDQLKIYLGEAKFRGTPANAVLNELKEAMAKDKLPLSYSFLINRLYEDPHTVATAQHLESFLIQDIKTGGNLKYVGMLLSNHNAGNFIEANFSSDNPHLVIISASSDAPADIVDRAFARAQELLANPTLI